MRNLDATRRAKRNMIVIYNRLMLVFLPVLCWWIRP